MSQLFEFKLATVINKMNLNVVGSNSGTCQPMNLLNQGGSAHQNTGGVVLEFPMRTTRHEYLFAIINKILIVYSSEAVAQWVRPWGSNHRVVQAEGSRPRRDVYQMFFSNDFYFSFMLGLMDFSDIAILCGIRRPNSCCQQNLKCFDKPLISLGLFS